MSIRSSGNGRGPTIARPLPTATRSRWTPLRSGLVNLYRYDDEEFWYEQGRMLLRGNNGTGKSRVLALQLPFLLDGDVRPHRLEPDGDPAKRVEWNLLMGRHRDRLGYTWIEFGRRDGDGVEHYVTLGCGLHAVEGRGNPDHWFFIASRRVGRDLHLVIDGHASSRDRLAEMIGERGDVFTTAAAYRAAINAALFRVSEHQYGALIGLLIQLRQPQLQRQLDEKRLSAALGEALRPMPPNVIGDIADAFRGLETDRLTVDAFEAARAGADRFLVDYRRYAQVAARRTADGVRRTHAAYEATMRRLRAAEAERAAAVGNQERVAAQLDHLARDESALNTQVETLRGSPEMRSANELDTARKMADVLLSERDRALEALSRARVQASERKRESADAIAREVVARKAFDDARDHARAAAANAGVDADHERAVDGVASIADATYERGTARDPADGVRSRFYRIVDRREKGIARVRQLNQALADARRAQEEARAAHTVRSADYETALDELGAREAAHRSAVHELSLTWHSWVKELRELSIADGDAVAEALIEWSEHATGLSPVPTAVDAAIKEATHRLTALLADAQARAAVLAERLAALRADRDAIAGGRHTPPPPPHTRDELARAGREGAPLWKLCDFASAIGPAERAGYEAALEASGILDAWVFPDGRVLAADDADTVILAADDTTLSEVSTSTVLRPAIDADDANAAAVGLTTVERILARIGVGVGQGTVWIDADGSWRVGPLGGQWRKDAAQHIGESARESARRQRLTDLDREIEECAVQQRTVDEELRVLMQRERTMRAERDAVPADGGVRESVAHVTAAQRHVDSRRHEVAVAEHLAVERSREAALRLNERDQAATDLELAAWVDRLEELDRVLTAYHRATESLLTTAQRWADQVQAARSSNDRAREAAEERERAIQRGHEAERLAIEAVAARDTLHSAIGVAAKAILERLAAAERSREDVRGALSAAREEDKQLSATVIAADRDIAAHQETLARDSGDRQVAVTTMERFVATGLLRVAEAPVDDVDAPGWSVSRAVELSRRIEIAFARVTSDDAAWSAGQRSLHGHLQTLIEALQPHGYEPAGEPDGGVIVVTASFQGRRCSIPELRAALDREVVDRRQLLDAREREILENHLVGEAAQHLHELLREGNAWVARMNREMSERPTSTGMLLRFRWDPADDGPTEFPDIRRLLLRAAATWSPDEHTAVGAFLHRRIAVVREQLEGASWLEQLTAALDYRSWHRFVVERQQEGQWKRLTRRTHGTSSGGEKAIALTIPQFAAAAAHYQSADAAAPRLILLDEAFVGIDTDMRAKCMGLLAAFDLDFLMTSEREWACYATLPGVAIYQLATRPNVDAVGLTRWVWNGVQRVRADVPSEHAATVGADPVVVQPSLL